MRAVRGCTLVLGAYFITSAKLMASSMPGMDVAMSWNRPPPAPPSRGSSSGASIVGSTSYRTRCVMSQHE